MPNHDVPHLTPASLVGQRFGPDVFANVRVALVGFCPRPNQLDAYRPQSTVEQYFIHLPPASVELCHYAGNDFLSLSHVYGGPVASATVEELAYYGIETILAYGLAGSLGTHELAMGDFYLIEQALARDGTTPHYTAAELIASDANLNQRILAAAQSAGLPPFTSVQALTSDAIYREFEAELAAARAAGCDIVNCDSSHLFAVSEMVGIRCTQCGVISDATAAVEGEAWESTLGVMLSAAVADELNPLARTGEIAAFYAEVMLQELGQSQPSAL